MPMRALSISVSFLLWACAAYAGTAADGPSFMMISGISSSEEMCLTAADGARLDVIARARACATHACRQVVLTVMEQMWSWSRARLPLQQETAGSFGNSTRKGGVFRFFIVCISGTLLFVLASWKPPSQAPSKGAANE